MTRSTLRLLLAGCLFVGASIAHARCPIGVPPPSFYVGTDSKCAYSKIQDAITAVPSPTSCAPNIYVTNEHETWNEALTIDNRSLNLIGLSGACSQSNTTGASSVSSAAAAPTTPQATISGAGKNAPVITISGTSTVSVQNLDITGGNIGSGNEGGGILFTGAGALTLSASSIDNNQADYGGGIDVSPSGTTTLTLQANTLIVNNTAMTSGGGIRIEGDTHLVAVADQTQISFNTASNGYGGGIEMIGPAYADIGSPGYGTEGVIFANTGTNGGGIAVLANQGGDVESNLQMFTTVPDRPVRMQQNIATAAGGAIYMKPFAPSLSNDSFVNACLFNFRLDDNSAPEGAAVYLDRDQSDIDGAPISGDIWLNSTPIDPEFSCGSSSRSDFGAVACTPDTPCNEISGNKARDATGNATNGAVIYASNNASLGGIGFRIQNNEAGYVMHLLAGDEDYSSFSYFQSCLITDNKLSQNVVFSDGDTASLQFLNCTMADDVMLGDAIISVGTSTTLTLHSDLFEEIGKPILQQPGDTTLDARYIVSDDVSTLPVSASIVVINPLAGDTLFVDAANGDYRLAAYILDGSLIATRAIDFAETLSGDPLRDAAGNAYDLDVPAVPDFYGTRDIGALEAQPIVDRIFDSGFGDRVWLAH